MFSPFGASPVQREFIQVKAKKGEPGAFAITQGRTSSWVKTIPNPNYKPAEAPAPAAPPPAPPPVVPYTPEPLVPERTNQSSLMIASPVAPTPKPAEFSPGGIGADIESNAGGFRRKKSSAKMAGMTSKGTSQFKISGQSARSSGLNIGM